MSVAVQDASSLLIDPPLMAPGGGAATLRALAAAEYALDGGAGVPLTASDGAFDGLAELTSAASVAAAALPTGTHLISLRFRDSENR